ncbi:MAG: response regulator transcription factor [Lutibacter sp.]|uniref:LytR/AlgR family response regulator transcription factor n=1 Tax=Lutibacter sp. TaxID=1925666 RepID=UPI001843DBCA|nr:LytTR family DNA-binding domain-containing protein [Lutibacter sp.]MBT8316932.1 LytTR family DNA-binding domain-containing protein [Lutibacter sp.]NNJ57792.1 response regulator transcription factor [Lutibacter sp.]
MNKICNCIIVDDEPMAREILESHLQKVDAVHVVASCKNAVEAFNQINLNKIDLIFLDINMPEISGLSFAKSINKNIKVIFTTAYREYAIDGFNLQVVDYLLKPISFERLLQAVNKYLGENNVVEVSNTPEITPEKNDFIFVRADRKMVKIDFSEINYVESLSDYVKINLIDKVIVTRETISNIEAKLPKNIFMRVHRSYIIAITKIDSFTNEFIEVGSKAIPISRSYKKDVLLRLENV